MDGIPQGAKDGGAVISMDGVYAENRLERFQCISMDGWTDICSCNICTSTILGGRIPQGASDGDAVISMDGVADNFSMRDLHFLHPCRSYAENRLRDMDVTS